MTLDSTTSLPLDQISETPKVRPLNCLFIDDPHPWRQRRFELTLKQLQEAVQGTVALDRSLSFLHLQTQAVIDTLRSQEFLSYSLQYETFIKLLRKALKSPSYAKAYRRGYWDQSESAPMHLLHKLCIALFSSVDLGEFCLEVVELLEHMGTPTQASSESASDTTQLDTPLVHTLCPKDLLKSFPKTYQNIRACPQFLKQPLLHHVAQMAQGRLNLAYDPYVQENLPYVLFQISLNQRPVQALRLGTPTIEGIFSRAKVTPEFRGYLQALQAKGKKHVYFNLQHRKSRYLSANEAPRSHALEQLQYDFPETFTLVSLAKNSPFYYQTGKSAGISNASDFKRHFFHELFAPKGHFYFPKSLQEDSFLQQTRALIDTVHTAYFQDMPDLSLPQRLDFIEIFYTLLQESILIHCQADCYNTTCRDGIDRAGGANALFYFYHLLKEGRISSQEALQQVKAIAFAPAIFVKKRAISQYRLKRFLTAAHRMLDHWSLHSPFLLED